MEHFVLITNEGKDKDFALTNKIADYIRSKGGTAVCLVSNVESQNDKEFSLDDVPSDTQCIFVLGGDGTLIRAATKVGSLHIPLMGINLGTLGYLCEVEEATVFDAVDQLFNDDYMIEERMMLEASKNDFTENIVRTNNENTEKKNLENPPKTDTVDVQKHVALNDIVIHGTGGLQMLSVKVCVNGEYLSNYFADGIIVATPTGSTGYNMSAGGPIVDPTGDMLILTPNNAHNLSSKSIVLSGDDVIEIEICHRRTDSIENAYVSCDGDKIMKLSAGDKVRIKRAIHYTKICRLHKRSFLEILRKKMEGYT